MSMQDSSPGRGRDPGNPERRSRLVASYDDYEAAERAVDALSDRGFPVERVAIVGRGLHYVERITGRMGWLEATLRGALAGAIAGVLIGWLFFVFDWFSPLVARGWLIFDGLWFGLLAGALTGLVSHALLRGRRDFASVGAVRADHYDLLVEEDVADQAAALLAEWRADEARFSRTDAPQRATDPARHG
jgi:hypothetical protein